MVFGFHFYLFKWQNSFFKESLTWSLIYKQYNRINEHWSVLVEAGVRGPARPAGDLWQPPGKCCGSSKQEKITVSGAAKEDLQDRRWVAYTRGWKMRVVGGEESERKHIRERTLRSASVVVAWEVAARGQCWAGRSWGPDAPRTDGVKRGRVSRKRAIPHPALRYTSSAFHLNFTPKRHQVFFFS